MKQEKQEFHGFYRESGRKLLCITAIVIVFLLLAPDISAFSDNMPNMQSDAKSINGKENTFAIYKELAGRFHDAKVYDSAIIYYQKALEISSLPEDRLFCLKKIGNVYIDSTNNNMALLYLKKALTLNEKKVHATDQYPGIYNLIGMGYGLSNKLDSAIGAFNDALHFNRLLKDSSGIGFSYYNLGLANHFKGEYEKAIEFFVLSAGVREQIKDASELTTSLISIGEILRIREDYLNARVYYNEALKHKKGIENKQTLAYLYSELALINKTTENYNSALAYIDTAMYYCNQIGYKRGIATLLNYKAGIFRNQNKTREAFGLYKKTLDKYQEIGFEIGIVQSSIAIAEIYIQKGDNISALKVLESVIQKAADNHLLSELVQINGLKYTILKELGQFENAIEIADKYMVLKDSLFNINKEEKISEIESKYQNQQKQKQIELLDRDNKIKEQKLTNRNIIIAGSSVFILFLAFTFLFIFRQNRLKSGLKLELNKQKLLRSQMNPHFIYNSLGAIQNYILKNDPKDSIVYISEFSLLMRLVLEGTRDDLISLKDDIKLINSYLKLQKLRFANGFDYIINIDEIVNTDLLKIPPMLSQPFIENAVEHGICDKVNGDGRIRVDYNLKDSGLEIVIKDNGHGILPEEKEKKRRNHKSLATKITKERIDNIRKTLNLNISLNIYSDIATGTRIELIIPQK